MPLPASLARFNKKVTNRITTPFARHLPGFGIVVHQGRRSGRTYRNPVSVFHRSGGYAFALTYGRDPDWVRNVLAAGSAHLVTRGHERALTNPRIVNDPTRSAVPAAVRPVLRAISVDDFLLADTVA